MSKKIETLEDAAKFIKQLPNIKYFPRAGSAELIEISKVMEKLPELKYPIASAGELIEKLGGPDKRFEIEGIKVNPVRMIKYMPAYYFPIFSKENFIEKMAELIKANRKRVDLAKEIKNLKEQLPKLDYPISSAEELVEKLGNKIVYRFEGEPIAPEKMVKHIPFDYFPINSDDEFHEKIMRLIVTRPLIKGH